MNEVLKIIKNLPQGFLTVKPSQITDLIKNPTLIDLKGEKNSPLFVSILLHGNEYSGLLIMQQVLKQYKNKALPRDLILFIGNPQAVAKGQRHLAHQADFNRIWKPGSRPLFADSVLKYVKHKNIRLGLDIHNNSGKNPLYACVTQKQDSSIKLAQKFSDKIVFFKQPDSVLSKALSPLCPAIVIECGQAGDLEGLKKGVKLIQSLLQDPQDDWRQSPITVPNVYYTFGLIRIQSDLKVSFASPPVLKNSSLCLIKELESLNFKKLPPGLLLGKTNSLKGIQLIDKFGKNIFDQYFSIKNTNWLVKSSFIPSMLTKNLAIAKSDCLAYTMDKISIEQFFDEWREDTVF